ncbi:hypothetical protein GDO78_020047 [Eleutherodactylus coqui]|uniref:Uncharacterized protein n=1 Tax=Eleutherodactylus coqui TaxID=57060 RepID=A0A8J6E5J1_ELECQ|nr:hypothetical protein GDO78_020047 [Eleutherodactylus coqui]
MWHTIRDLFEGLLYTDRLPSRLPLTLLYNDVSPNWRIILYIAYNDPRSTFSAPAVGDINPFPVWFSALLSPSLRLPAVQ